MFTSSSLFSRSLLGLLIVVSTALIAAIGMVGYDAVTTPPIRPAVISFRQQDDRMVLYNAAFGYSFILPYGWKEGPSTTETYQSFFDPRALEQHLDTDVLQGMKLEVYVKQRTAAPLDDLAEQARRAEPPMQVEGRRDVDGATAVLLVDNSIGQYLHTIIKHGDVPIEIHGYIAEPDRQDAYRKVYDAVVGSLRFDE